MKESHILRSTLALAAATMLAGAIGCSGSPQQTSEPSTSTTTTESAPPPPPPPPAADDLAEREKEVARREAEVALQEREKEIARREAALTTKPPAPKPSSKGGATPSSSASSGTTGSSMASAPPPPPPPPPAPITMPAGTQLSVEVMSPLTTKTAKVGDRIDARLAAPLVIDGKTVAREGAAVQGAVTQVVSGSKKIGGTPTLGLTFDGLEVASGSMVAISGNLVQQGKSETAKDSAKIAGAVVAGAIIGHQVNEDKGKLIGGLLGGAAGTAAAAKTGKEVDVPAGTIVGFALDAPVLVD